MNDRKFRTDPRVDWMKERMSPEEKTASLTAALNLLQKLTLKGVQGNVSFPLFEGGIGKARVELYVDPTKAKDIFSMEE